MKRIQNKSDSETLRQKAEELLKKKSEDKILELIEELAFQNEEKAKRADELLIANKELSFQNEEKAKRDDELLVANKELAFQNEEKAKRAEELIIANKELAFQNEEKTKRADELLIANKELAFEQENLRKIASLVPGVVYQYLLRPDGTSCFPYASEAIREIYRVSPEQVREDASAVFANLHPDDLAVVAASIQASAQNLTPWQHEFRVKFKDGTIRSLYGNALPQREADGSVLWHGFITDITGHKQKEEELKQSEQRYQALVEWSPYAAIVHRDMKIVCVNPAAVKLFGATSEQDLVGTPVMAWHHPDYHQIVRERIRKAADEGLAAPMIESKYFKLDGTVMDLEVQGIPIIYNELPSILATFNDVTQRRRAEEKLKQVSVRLELAARAGGVGIWDYDIVSNVLLWDEQMFALYGIDRKDFIGVYEAWQNGVHPDDKERGNQEIQMAIRGEKEFDSEFRVVWPDSSIHNIRALAVVQRDESGNALRMIGTNWDITKIRKAEKEKLDDSESRYRSIFYGSPDGILIADEETKMIVFANPTQCQLLGYTEDELKTMTIAGIHPEVTFPDTLARFESIAHGEKTIAGNIQCIKKNREIFFVDIATSFITINSRKCIVGFFHDITQRRHSEEALRDSNAYLDNLINYANAPIIVWDPQFHITRFNHAFEHLTGRSEAEVIGQPLYILFPPAQVSHSMSLIGKTISGERWETVEIGIQHLDKSVRTLLWNSATLFAPDGHTPMVTIAQGHDITQRKQAEYKLKNNAALLTNLIINLYEGVLLEDSNRKILLTNQLFCDMFGIPAPPEALLGADCSNAAEESKMFFKDPVNFIADIKVILARKQAVLNDELELADGRFFERDYIPTYLDHEYNGHLWKYRDITHRKQSEIALKDALVKAEASNRLKTAFMNNISHEVRTPLNGIMGFGSLLTDPNLTTEERKHYNQLLKASGNRLINTITDYMDISLIASENIEVSLKPVNVRDLLKELQAKFQDSCDVKNLMLNLTISREQEHLTLITDAELLRRIIACLLDNAIKFTSLGLINFGYSVKSSTIDFFVIDTGIGIAPEALERIIEPFMQENIDNTRGHEGSGLGLSIISGFLKLLGGEIRLESVKGQGASFFFSLPMDPGTTEENEPIAPPIPHAEIIRPVVLVAEDDISNDLYMEIILKSFASVVFKAANGKEAVEMCQLHPEISLVLMDLKMPVMDGFEATRQIKSFRKELPIIAITAYAFSKDKKKALEIGCDDFLSKPVSKHDLLEKFKKFGFLE